MDGSAFPKNQPRTLAAQPAAVPAGVELAPVDGSRNRRAAEAPRTRVARLLLLARQMQQR